VSDLTTPLHAWHVAHKAKMAPFAGWDMPIQYSGIIAEHQATRTQAGLFDICHMGEFLLAGPGAKAALAAVVSHNLETLAPGRCRYGFLLNPQGGVMDDLIVYCLGPDDYMLVVNAACIEQDFTWISSHLPAGFRMTDISDATAKIDLQGPLAMDVLELSLQDSFRDLKYFAFTRREYAGAPLLVSRTGYTGELGVELYLPVENVERLWNQLLADSRVAPCGLGARDTLRLEVGLPLYGHDLDQQHTPAEAGYGAMLSSPADYIGKAGAGAVRERLLGLVMEGRRSARHGDAVLSADGAQIGRVTSGSFAPSLGHAVALAYVAAERADDPRFLVQAAKTQLDATPAAPPFYAEGTARMKL